MNENQPLVRLAPVDIGDLEQLKIWRNDLMEDGTVRQWRYLNSLDQEVWWQRVSTGNEHIMMAVRDEDGRLIGVVGLCYVDWARKKSEASIYIGSQEHRGKGYGKAALHALINYGFGKLGMNRIWAEIFITNRASIGLFEACGFVCEGTMRESHFHNGKWVDARVYSMLFSEWEKCRYS